MNRLKDLYLTTIKLQQLSCTEIPAAKREETLTEIAALIEERDRLIAMVKPPYTEEEKVTGRELLPIDQAIQEKLASLFAQVKNDLRNVKKQKSSNVKYANPYKQAANYDGMFLDHKK